MKAACIVCNAKSFNEAIEHAHDAVRLRNVKKSANSNRKVTSKWKKDKKLEEDIIRQMLKYDVPTDVQLNTMIEKTRKDISFHQTVKGKTPFDVIRKPVENFHVEMTQGVVYKELVALYSMREYMEDVNPASVKSFIKFLVQTKEGAHCFFLPWWRNSSANISHFN